MTNEETVSKKRSLIGIILSWIIGIFFALIGIEAIGSEPIPGIAMLLMATVLLPPINKFANDKWKICLSGKVQTVVIIFGFIIVGSIVETSKTVKQERTQSQVQQEQKHPILNTKQQNEQTKSTEEKPKTINSGKPSETKTAATNPASEEKQLPVKNTAVSAEDKSALNKATTYANSMHLSKQGVYDQLISEYGEKFSTSAAQYAIDNVKADWNMNALVKARTYQGAMNMSQARIHEQLTSVYGEKFTQAEADYAMQHLSD